jgi:uncharacterized protein
LRASSAVATVRFVRIGLISDTHLPQLVRQLDELGPEVGDFLSTVDLILHGGDVTAPAVLEWCGQYGDLLVARGNNDSFHDPRMTDIVRLDVDGWRIGMVHELRPESRPMDELIQRGMKGEQVDILIGGDTHVERLEWRDDVLLVNSGSPILPHHMEVRLGSVAVLEIEKGRVRAEIIKLGETPGRRNPVRPSHIEVVEGKIVSASYDGVLLPVGEEEE